jgi:hypothetical protein
MYGCHCEKRGQQWRKHRFLTNSEHFVNFPFVFPLVREFPPWLIKQFDSLPEHSLSFFGEYWGKLSNKKEGANSSTTVCASLKMLREGGRSDCHLPILGSTKGLFHSITCL